MNANVMITIIFINSFESIRHSNVGNTKSASKDPKIRVSRVCKTKPVPFKLNGFHSRLLC